MQAQSKISKQHTFVAKLSQILSDPRNSPIIAWETNQSTFAVFDVEKFERFTLPQYFRHCRFSSFVRQLNMYGFHKVRTNKTSAIRFHNNGFTKENAQRAEIGRKQMIIPAKKQLKTKYRESLTTFDDYLNTVLSQESCPLRIQQPFEYNNASWTTSASIPASEQEPISDIVLRLAQQVKAEDLGLQCDVLSRIQELICEYPYNRLDRKYLPFVYEYTGISADGSRKPRSGLNFQTISSELSETSVIELIL